MLNEPKDIFLNLIKRKLLCLPPNLANLKKKYLINDKYAVRK